MVRNHLNNKIAGQAVCQFHVCHTPDHLIQNLIITAEIFFRNITEWLLAVSVGGSLFGIVGMLAFIPLTSVVYTLVREEVHKRMERKQMIS